MGEFISDLELSITKLLDIKDDKSGNSNSNHMIMELRDHLIEIYNKVGVGLLKKHVHYQE